MEFEAFDAGTLLYIGIKEGDTAPVDSVLAVIGKEGEDYKALLDGGSNAKAEETPKEEAKAEQPKAEEVKPEAKEEKPEEDKKAASSALPEGVVVVTMPRLSDTMTDGTVATWLKKVGDSIKEGDILAEIETDKATMEFESFNAGTLLAIGVKEGETAPVDSLLMQILQKVAQLLLLRLKEKTSLLLKSLLKIKKKTLRKNLKKLRKRKTLLPLLMEVGSLYLHLPVKLLRIKV
jgi:pyruvate/2-oxoglutarate dehydrogenase complex dihydrolipoamide acyltransferase (E2) component